MTRAIVRFVALTLGVSLAAFNASKAEAQAPQGQVTVVVTGFPDKPLPVVTLSAKGVTSVGKPTAVAGEVTFPSTDFNAGATVRARLMGCRGVEALGGGLSAILAVSLGEPGVPLPTGCTTERRLGSGTWTASTRLIVQFSGAPRSWIVVNPYAMGGATLTSFGGASGACDTIDRRFTDAFYNTWTCGTDTFDVGWNVGGGARLRLGALPRSFSKIDVSLMYTKLGGPSLNTTGDRTQNNLTYTLDADLAYTTTSLRFGPSFHLGRRALVTPLIGIDWWSVRAGHAFTLLAGQPQTQVNGGSRLDDEYGVNWSYGGRFEYKLGSHTKGSRNQQISIAKRLSLVADVFLQDVLAPPGPVYGPNAEVPWPLGAKRLVINVGAKYSLKSFRRVDPRDAR